MIALTITIYMIILFCTWSLTNYLDRKLNDDDGFTIAFAVFWPLGFFIFTLIISSHFLWKYVLSKIHLKLIKLYKKMGL